MASIIIASIALAFTFLIYLYGAWRFLRFPRFWVTSAQADVKVTSDKPPIWLIRNVTVSVAYRGGGQPRNIIDMGFVMFNERDSTSAIQSTTGWLKEVIHVPSELAGRFAVEVPGVLRIDNMERDELTCSLRLDCGVEPYEIPFSLRGPGETWFDTWSSFDSPISLIRFPRKGVWRVLDWMRSR